MIDRFHRKNANTGRGGVRVGRRDAAVPRRGAPVPAPARARAPPARARQDPRPALLRLRGGARVPGAWDRQHDHHDDTLSLKLSGTYIYDESILFHPVTPNLILLHSLLL